MWVGKVTVQGGLCGAPALCEYLLTNGMTAHNVLIGDLYRWGEVFIQVTKSRSPCFKLNFHVAISDMARLMQNSGKTGWPYRVIAPGNDSSDPPLVLPARLSYVSVLPPVAIARFMLFDSHQYT